EEVLFAGVAALELVGAVENELGIADEIDRGWRGRRRVEPGGCRTIEVEVLIEAVQWRREEAAALPLDCLLRPALGLPDRGGASAVHDVDEGLEKVALDLRLTAWRDLIQLPVVDLLRREVDESALLAGSGPGRDLERVQIADV